MDKLSQQLTCVICYFPDKKDLKVPKESSEVLNRGRTDNTMAKRKNDKRTNNDTQNIAQKTKDRAT